MCQAARLRQRSELKSKRRKLLELYYADKTSQDLFGDEEGRIGTQLAALDQPTEEPLGEQST